MARDYARQRKNPGGTRRKGAARKTAPAREPISGWRWYFSGVLSGVLLSFLAYLGSLAPDGPASADAGAALDSAQGESAPPKPRFDFYTLLPEQTIEVESDPGETARARSAPETSASDFYLLQAGSFRQREDADRRRAELLLLGLEPRVEETSGDNGRWFRVYLGPFDSRAKVSRARSLTAGQDIDTLLLKRSGNP